MNHAVAIVGMACRYADARAPHELWENALAQRQAFRRMPAERLRLEDYFAADRQASDSIYSTEAALLEGYEFDRVRFRVVGSTFRSADLTHWLALDVANEALADAGFPDGAGLPREMTGVLLGNTLAGEFSRANVMRLRWPFVRRVVGAALVAEGWTPERRQAFLDQLEQDYKAPFPPVGEETLAGGMSNTIAGRICNHFDLKGGGYTVDGACASSLLAIANACSALAAGDLDVILAGGVDLSLDPFELVGFARTGALAPEKMRIYDARSAGFWPGEGCGFVVLMRQEDALAQGRRMYALVRGWGVSSDGSGGITRPEVEGQILAVRRAYRRAGFGIETVGYFEGHGTGTAVGDATELRTLSRARREAAAPGQPPAAIGSIKANIGHTKAAAGVAGVIKATLALHHQIMPPTTGSETPHPELNGGVPALQTLAQGRLWPEDQPLRAGVSAMGFGGINTHLVLEAAASQRRTALAPQDRALLASAQDAELFVLSADSAQELEQQIVQLAALAPKLARAELTDLAAHLAGQSKRQALRAAIVAATPAELTAGLETLRTWLADGLTTSLDVEAGVFLGGAMRAPRIGLLFPGQGSPSYLNGGALRRRFAPLDALYARAGLPADGNTIATHVAQPAIVTASLAALWALERLGIAADSGLGHSLGEITALHWAGALSEQAVLRIATARGRAMADLGSPTGAMASIEAGRREIEWLLNGDAVSVACFNSPRQTVISGTAAAVSAVVARAQARGLQATSLPVSHAFHSPLVAAAVPALAEQLEREEMCVLQRVVVSTVTGATLAPDTDLRALLHQQVTAPVRFTEAVAAADERVDLWIEAGPGQVLSGLVSEFMNVPVIALDAGGPSLRGLLRACGAAFALGAPVRPEALFADRFARPFALDWQPRFLVNPCELAPLPDEPAGAQPIAIAPAEASLVHQNGVEPPLNPLAQPAAPDTTAAPIDLVRAIVAERIEIPVEAVRPSDHLLSDLHLNSIAVTQLVTEAARRLNLAPLAAPGSYANATIAEVAEALGQIAGSGGALADEEQRLPLGIAAWVRGFTIELVEQPSVKRPATLPPGGDWQVFAPPQHPLAEALRTALQQAGAGSGVAICLPPSPDERAVGLLLQAAQAALKGGGGGRFVLAQQGGGAAALARTLHLEAPKIPTCVVDLPFDHPQAAEWAVAEALAVEHYAEVHYDRDGRRRAPLVRPVPQQLEPLDLPLGPGDVLLVLGGGKGITAECALALARESGARLVLMGRSQPEADAELAANLQRMAAHNIAFDYLAVDIIDPEAVRVALHDMQARIGPITGVLHGAARNEPQLIGALDELTFQRTLAPKLQGLRNVLAAIEPHRLRMLVTFGSIIARMGLPGEADYGVANEWLVRMTEEFQAQYPACRCLAVEWSVWSEVGMGARLGRIEALMREGITPIPLEEGIAMLRWLLTRRLPQVAVVVAGRWRDLPTFRVERPELPLLRFIERPRAYYPGVELIVDADLSADTDPYLADHEFRGERLFPAVMGLEAMAQAVRALVGEQPLAFEDARFLRPIAVPPRSSVTLRLAALSHGPDLVEVTLRSSETGFQADHFRARCRLGAPAPCDAAPVRAASGARLAIDPDRDLYGGLLFHTGRFRRLHGYQELMATHCVAEIGAEGNDGWFGPYLPPTLLLGDPGARDAAIHAIQVCVPHLALLPVSVERFTPADTQAPGPWLAAAQERWHEGDTYVYDVEVHCLDGTLRERWEGLRLQAVSGAAFRAPWVDLLLGPYIERRLRELLPGAALTVALEPGDSSERRARGDRAIQRALGKDVPIWRRADGKPEVNGEQEVSLTHTQRLSLAVAGQGAVGCDLEPVQERSAAVWLDLLGYERLELAQVIAREAGESLSVAATRVWAAAECLKKAGAMVDAPLTLARGMADGWVLLVSGALTVATCVALMRDAEAPLVAAALGRHEVYGQAAALPAHIERLSERKTAGVGPPHTPLHK